MRLLIIGSLAAELGMAAKIAVSRGARLQHAETLQNAMEQLRASPGIDVVICDLAYDIATLVRSLQSERIAAPVVAAGAVVTDDQVMNAIRAGAQEFLPLPPDPDLIAAILQAAAGTNHNMIARDPVMLQTIQRADQVSISDASVLISGESGTGKEVLARYIHQKSKRANGPFIALNCAAIPEALLESELFGHEKGAFSGAIARRVGKFEAANGGTLLLDEISEMDIRLQAKLLRAVQEREIDRVGGTHPVKIDVRILATTNRNMKADIKAGRFREDLYFRLSVVTITVPSLRDRPGDIPLLANHFALRYAELNGLPRRPLAPASVEKLVRNHWSGNIRELENTIHRAVLLGGGDRLEPNVIETSQPESETAPMPEAAAPAAASIAVAAPSRPMEARSVHDVEREHILRTVQHCFGNRTHAATILGISIRALRNKLNEYAAQGMDVPRPNAGVAA
jgi:DNA-binding NtrC family response regulator